MTPAAVLLVCGLAAAIALVTAQPGFNPCHDNRSAMGENVTCKKVTFPRGMCRACVLKEPEPNGTLTDCKSIYDLTHPTCMRKLQRYARRNRHCDPVRERQVASMLTDPASLQGLDYFVYSICEECCDCIPIGAAATDVGARDLKRGNCPAHARADICEVLPNIGYTRLAGDPPAPRNREIEPVCPHLQAWFDGLNGPWKGTRTDFNDAIRAFLAQLWKSAMCSKYTTWTRCWVLEHQQQRV